MKSDQPKIAVIIISYNEQENVDVCLKSLYQQSVKNFEILVVDNASTDGSVAFIKRYHPRCTLIELSANLGYAGGNNVAVKHCFANGFDLALLLNADTITDIDLLKNLAETYEKFETKQIGLIQPVILLESNHSLINTIGNAIHYCGFGYCKDYTKKRRDVDLTSDREIISASGAALLVSKKYYDAVGFLDEDFFMYNEDQNYSWRGLMLGYTHYLSAKAIVYHSYSFSKNPLKMYHSEKNRWLMLLENYQWSTLLLLLPILLILELLLLGFSLLTGWFGFKIKTYGYLLTHMQSIKKQRASIQSHRTVSDTLLLRKFVVRLDSAIVRNRLITSILNPILAGYYQLLLILKGS